jgi:transcriptional regulator with XRE-family HTH domain
MEQTDINRLLSTLARRIKERRKLLGLTQEELADRAGVHPNFISRMEIAGRTPSLGTLSRLAQVLGVEVPYLLTDSEEAALSDVCRYVENSLGLLDEADAEFVMSQFRQMVEHLRRKPE